jgi:hydrogenase nickel incorporation protein HypA/HybF
MHELAIAESVLRVAERHAAGRPVAVVELEVGHLRQVVPDALRFAWSLLIEGTALAGARLEIEEVPAKTRCGGCGTVGMLESFPAACARCGGLDVTVTGGDALSVTALELEEEALTTSGG